MRKKIFSILLIIILMTSMLLGLTACGDEDDEEKSHSSSKEAKSDSEILDREDEQKKVTSPEEFVNEFVEYVNNEDVENIIDSMDIVGMLAYDIVYNGNDYTQGDYEATASFENAYEWVESIKNNSAVNVNKKSKEKILEYIPALKGTFRMIFAENIEDVDIQIDKIGKVKKLDNEERLYSVNVEVSGSAKINGKKQSFEDKDDVYMIEKNGNYYIIWSKWGGVKSEVVDYYEFYDESKSLIERSILSALFNYKNKFYAEDDYAEYTFAEKMTEADFCEEMNGFMQGVFTVKDLDTSKEYSQDDQYDGDSKKLLVDGNKVYICFDFSSYSDLEYYYVTFKEGQDGSIEIDELKQFVDGKWTDIDEEKNNEKRQEAARKERGMTSEESENSISQSHSGKIQPHIEN